MPSRPPTSTLSRTSSPRSSKSHGGVGVNAFTNYDETAYMYSLPSNQVELVGGAGIGSHEASRFARVLQRAQRGDGRAPHAHRQQTYWPAGRAVSRHGVHGQSLSPADHRLCFRSRELLRHRRGGILPALLRSQQHGNRIGRRPRSRQGVPHHRALLRPASRCAEAD